MRKIFFVLLAMLMISCVYAQSSDSAVFVNRPTYGANLYGAEASTYWPILNNAQSCMAREDILIQVSPAGCKPVVVRSDLLAEQNVPVFCEIDALKINPFVNIDEIRNIRFTGDYPEGVVGVGFHPARASLRSGPTLIGSPLVNNIGYVVVVLARNPNEAELPDFLNFTLSAAIDYQAQGGFGIGASQFFLNTQSDDEWKLARNKQSILKGDYFVRLNDFDENSASLSFYQGDRKVSDVVARRGEQSLLYLPGSYCRAGLNVIYDGQIPSDNSARLRVNDEFVEVVEGSSIANGACRVTNLDIEGENVGSLDVVCRGQRVTLKLGDIEGESTVPSELRSYYQNAIDGYKRVFLDYPAERDSEDSETYGEKALSAAIELAEQSNDKLTADDLRELAPEAYVDDFFDTNLSLASKAVRSGNEYIDFTLLGFNVANIDSSASFDIGSLRERVLKVGDSFEFTGGSISLLQINDFESARVGYRCSDEDNGELSFRIGEEKKEVCGEAIGLNNIDAQRLAKVRLVPVMQGTRTETNFTVGIGIEKRAIQLNPDKAEEKIDTLNATVAKWETISDNLGKVVTGLKGACLATAGALTVKNFLTGLDGTALARNQVMEGHWNQWCAQQVSSGNSAYASIDDCYLENAEAINADVEQFQQALSEVNSEIESVEGRHRSTTGGLGEIFGDSVVDSEKAADDFLDQEIDMGYDISQYGITNPDETPITNLNGLFEDTSYQTGDYSYQQLRDLRLNMEVAENPQVSEGVRAAARERIRDISASVATNKKISYKINQERNRPNSVPLAQQQLVPVDSSGMNLYLDVSGKGQASPQTQGELGSETSHVARVPIRGNTVIGDQTFQAGDIAVLGLSQGADGSYVVEEVLVENGDGSVRDTGLSEAHLIEFQDTYGINGIQERENVNYNNKYQNAELRYYEREPYKGYPAIVPFDVQNGWYAATEQTLPVFGEVGSFDASGRPVSFWVCNVGEDGREQFFQNRGGDICQKINLNTGQPIDQFPGLTEEQARIIVNKAVNALQEASRQYASGKRNANIGGYDVLIGEPAATIPSSQCQNFMSPQECALIFNVCDPVICPSSRCDFGGSYPVADVIQTGIVGSALLCLPNSFLFGGDVAIPVCLTGIQAGVDSYVSILKSHQQCLQENLESGETVGICDAITSVYTCEFFWRQAAPLADVFVPKLFEVASGGARARGGAEYLTVQSSWDNAQDSVQFFTQNYAANSFEAFKLRSVGEAGSQVCRAFISTKGPNLFKALVTPDSPPQYHAWFSSIPYNDATIPATSQYKVFYHIFAGKDRGAYYDVYLKEPPTASYYSYTPTVQVASGFIQKGDFATETIDFTAPEGYKQLCIRVDGKEECGFKQVTTSFALDYVRDSFVANELGETDITSEQACIAGERFDPSALLNVNSQAGLEEAVNPAAYNRGVVRICSSGNPGSQTDPSRFVNVGYCGDQSIGCWLDRDSIQRSLSDNVDVNILGNTNLAELEQNEIQKLEEQGIVYPEAYINDVITGLNAKLKSVTIATIERDIIFIDSVYDRTLNNRQKAQLLLIRAQYYAQVVRPSIAVSTEGNIVVPETQVQTNSGVATSVTTSPNVPPAVIPISCSVSLVSKNASNLNQEITIENEGVLEIVSEEVGVKLSGCNIEQVSRVNLYIHRIEYPEVNSEVNLSVENNSPIEFVFEQEIRALSEAILIVRVYDKSDNKVGESSFRVEGIRANNPNTMFFVKKN